jgi:Amt family ammonium transporter
VPVDTLFPVGEGRAIPTYLHVLFQGAFAAITCAIVLGAIAERARFFGAMIFILIWLFLAYVPIAHMVWHHSTAQDGLLAGWKVLDHAGGLVVHVNAGVAGLCAAYMIDKRAGFGRSPLAPHSLSTVMTGTALLWIGWAGFNAGSALGANSAAALAFINTFIASCAGCLVWVMVDKWRYGKSTALGAASGVLAGLVGITPAAGFVAPWAALVMGGLAAFCSFYAIGMVKRRWGIDDALDVFAIHGVSGLVGSLLVGIFAFSIFGGTQSVPDNLSLSQAVLGQMGVQALSVVVAIAVSALATFVALFCADALTTLRLSEADEAAGLDSVDHDETAYNFLNE